MSRYLLDTNVISALMRDPAGLVLARIEAAGEEAVYTSVIVAAELRFGAAKKNSARLAAEIDAVLSRITIVPLASPVDRIYAELRSRLEQAGTPMGANDLLIASQALQDDSTVVTANLAEFGRVPNLRTENWVGA